MKLFESLKKRWIIWVWNHTPNCMEISRLASLSLDRPLSLRMRFKMGLHSLICVWCKRYARHLRFLQSTAPRMREEFEATSSPGLSNEAIRRILERLREEHRR